MYFLPDNKTLCVPVANLKAFLAGQRSLSVAKIASGRAYKELAMAYQGFVIITPSLVPVLCDGEPVVFNGFVDGVDEATGIYVDNRKAVAPGSKPVPIMTARPVLPLPWELEFNLSIIGNRKFTEESLVENMNYGGMLIGLCAGRSIGFGKFTIAVWE